MNMSWKTKAISWFIIFSAIGVIDYLRTEDPTKIYIFLIVAPFCIPVTYLTRNWHPLRNFYNWAHRNDSDELTDSEESS